jgi:hypothetical protein
LDQAFNVANGGQMEQGVYPVEHEFPIKDTAGKVVAVRNAPDVMCRVEAAGIADPAIVTILESGLRARATGQNRRKEHDDMTRPQHDDRTNLLLMSDSFLVFDCATVNP